MRPDVIICDRCGLEQRDEPGRGNWAQLASQSSTLVPVVVRQADGGQRRVVDICPACVKAFGEWWKAGKP